GTRGARNPARRSGGTGLAALLLGRARSCEVPLVRAAARSLDRARRISAAASGSAGGQPADRTGPANGAPARAPANRAAAHRGTAPGSCRARVAGGGDAFRAQSVCERLCCPATVGAAGEASFGI